MWDAWPILFLPYQKDKFVPLVGDLKAYWKNSSKKKSFQLVLKKLPGMCKVILHNIHAADE